MSESHPEHVAIKSAGILLTLYGLEGCKKEQPARREKPAGCVGPGSDLLSRDLSSDYHRRANVSLPGSGWDRVGPLGCDHQAAAGYSRLRLSAVCLGVVFWMVDIRVAGKGIVFFQGLYGNSAPEHV